MTGQQPLGVLGELGYTNAALLNVACGVVLLPAFQGCGWQQIQLPFFGRVRETSILWLPC